LRKRGIVQLCTTVDAWCPAAQQYDLGRRCLEALLADPGWTVRILTKNAAVARDFDIMEKHRERVLIGLSLTGTRAKDDVLSIIEPNASPVSERMEVLAEAHKRGLRTFGMLCPLMPGIADSPGQIDELIAFLESCGVEEVFAEAVIQQPLQCIPGSLIAVVGTAPQVFEVFLRNRNSRRILLDGRRFRNLTLH
jgi:DNA repair photolyase